MADVPARTQATERDAAAREAEEVTAWAASGAMALTGRPHAPPLGPPAGLVSELRHLEARLTHAAHALGGQVTVDSLGLLGERAALTGLRRRGTTSCGGSTRLLRAEDGWLAVTLARPDDVELVPAWLECPAPIDDAWRVVTDAIRTSRAGEMADRGGRLGLPVAVLPEPFPVARGPARGAELPVRALAIAGPVPPRPTAELVVVDLSSLWAGPLCGSLLAAAGAQVVKVESVSRPDGARAGAPGFFDLLNAGKRSVALDLASADGVQELARLLAHADIVIEGSRPRALEQLGIHAEHLLRAGRVRVWTSITGHGRTGAARNRVGFGDDTAAAGGLVSWDRDGPCFCADAIADPVTGLVAALATLERLRHGGRWLLDVPMAGVAAHLAGPTLATGPGLHVAAPRARTPTGPAPTLGEHGELLDRRSG